MGLSFFPVHIVDHPLVVWAFENGAILSLAAVKVLCFPPPQRGTGTVFEWFLSSFVGGLILVESSIALLWLFTNVVYRHIPRFFPVARSSSVGSVASAWAGANLPTHIIGSALSALSFAAASIPSEATTHDAFAPFVAPPQNTTNSWRIAMPLPGRFPVFPLPPEYPALTSLAAAPPRPLLALATPSAAAAGAAVAVLAFLGKLAVARVVADVVFYAAHRLLHAAPAVYRAIHKRHHEHVTPSVVATNVQFTLTDLLLEGFLPLFVGGRVVDTAPHFWAQCGVLLAPGFVAIADSSSVAAVGRLLTTFALPPSHHGAAATVVPIPPPPAWLAGWLSGVGGMSIFEMSAIALYINWYEIASHAGKPIPLCSYFPPLRPLYTWLLGNIDAENVWFHEAHHRAVFGNFGITQWCDIAFGTRLRLPPPPGGAGDGGRAHPHGGSTRRSDDSASRRHEASRRRSQRRTVSGQ
eukprot:TRINITY_DN57353_c0_g1_i1.p1 TRINITY_DN57353_c0_g1~~TRINITY_DN57353_c0_g1_i1.p1  ORF type:complete len:467 (-),score=75.03 TRINITY_DN57353_c0_g1_i1:465-1865(-)